MYTELPLKAKFPMFLSLSAGLSQCRGFQHHPMQIPHITETKNKCRQIDIRILKFISTCLVVTNKTCLFCRHDLLLIVFTSAMCLCIKNAWFFPQNKSCFTCIKVNIKIYKLYPHLSTLPWHFKNTG